MGHIQAQIKETDRYVSHIGHKRSQNFHLWKNLSVSFAYTQNTIARVIGAVQLEVSVCDVLQLL